jgi:hypothetical protein
MAAAAARGDDAPALGRGGLTESARYQDDPSADGDLAAPFEWADTQWPADGEGSGVGGAAGELWAQLAAAHGGGGGSGGEGGEGGSEDNGSGGGKSGDQAGGAASEGAHAAAAVAAATAEAAVAAEAAEAVAPPNGGEGGALQQAQHVGAEAAAAEALPASLAEPATAEEPSGGDPSPQQDGELAAALASTINQGGSEGTKQGVGCTAVASDGEPATPAVAEPQPARTAARRSRAQRGPVSPRSAKRRRPLYEEAAPADTPIAAPAEALAPMPDEALDAAAGTPALRRSARAAARRAAG